MKHSDAAYAVLQTMCTTVWTTSIYADCGALITTYAIACGNDVGVIHRPDFRETSVKHCRVVPSNRPRQCANTYRGLTDHTATDRRLP